MKDSRIWTGIIEANFTNRRQEMGAKISGIEEIMGKKKISLSPVKENVKSEIS